MADHVDDFAHLWTTEREEWVVFRSDPEDVGLPYNRAKRQALLIDEDDELAAGVVQRMIDEGIPVVSTPPE